VLVLEQLVDKWQAIQGTKQINGEEREEKRPTMKETKR